MLVVFSHFFSIFFFFWSLTSFGFMNDFDGYDATRPTCNMIRPNDNKPTKIDKLFNFLCILCFCLGIAIVSQYTSLAITHNLQWFYFHFFFPVCLSIFYKHRCKLLSWFVSSNPIYAVRFSSERWFTKKNNCTQIQRRMCTFLRHSYMHWNIERKASSIWSRWDFCAFQVSTSFVIRL